MAWSSQELTDYDPRNPSVSQQLPDHLAFIIQKAAELIQPSKIILFGSRARGDARENSDFDLAFVRFKSNGWNKFCIDVSEDAPSLFKYELVDFTKADPPLREAITRDGFVLYEK